MNKKNIGIDVDGVLRDFLTPCIKIYNNNYDDGKVTVPEQVSDWNLQDELPQFSESFIHDHAKDLFYNSLPYFGAKEFMEELNNKHNVYVVTHQYPTLEKLTLQWLEEFGFKYKGFFSTPNKSLFSGEVLLDDSSLHVNKFPGKGVIFNQPWNAKEYCRYRVSSYNDFLRKVDKIIYYSKGYSYP